MMCLLLVCHAKFLNPGADGPMKTFPYPPSPGGGGGGGGGGLVGCQVSVRAKFLYNNYFI